MTNYITKPLRGQVIQSDPITELSSLTTAALGLKPRERRPDFLFFFLFFRGQYRARQGHPFQPIKQAVRTIKKRERREEKIIQTNQVNKEKGPMRGK